jgi:hypothetical protein
MADVGVNGDGGARGWGSREGGRLDGGPGGCRGDARHRRSRPHGGAPDDRDAAPQPTTHAAPLRRRGGLSLVPAAKVGCMIARDGGARVRRRAASLCAASCGGGCVASSGRQRDARAATCTPPGDRHEMDEVLRQRRAVRSLDEVRRRLRPCAPWARSGAGSRSSGPRTSTGRRCGRSGAPPARRSRCRPARELRVAPGRGMNRGAGVRGGAGARTKERRRSRGAAA